MEPKFHSISQKAIDEVHFQPDVDLFASRLNYKCKRYVSYQPDPGSYAVNAFYIKWTNLAFYAFPPLLYYSESSAKGARRRSNRSSCCPPLAYSTMVAVPR